MGGHSGTLTFLFTDIVGHTPLWDADAESMAAAMRDHDEVLEQVVETGGGTVVKNTGDGVMVTFPDADHAVDVAVALQEHFAQREWPGVGKLELRVGLHTGVADVRGGDYFGPDVIRAARLCDAGHGGQVLASRAVVELARDHQWLELGTHRLTGLREPVEVHQVVAAGLLEDFPALRTASARVAELPRFRSAFFGREHEIEELVELLDAHRLVTLTGVGGSGKTRLAVEVARKVLDAFADGAYFIDLSVVTEPARVWEAVASALALASSMGAGSDMTRRDAVVRYLAGRDALLVVDNCEHLLDAVADVVDDLLESTAEVIVLATSREGLHVEGERLVQVPSLRGDTAAVELLQDRARAGGAGPIEHDLAVRICERLDGLPLGIELVAARCGQLGAAEVVERLTDRFRLITGSRRRVSRQRTLEATLDWSYDLLEETEQSALRKLSVFTGGGSLAAIEDITGAGPDLVASLVDKSLVDRRSDGRFHMLETVRAYAEDRLVEAGEADATRQALATWLLERLEAEPPEELLLSTTSDVLDLLEVELDNLYASLDWAAGKSDHELIVRLATPAALALWEAADATLKPIIGHIRDCFDSGIDGDLRHLALAADVTSGWAAPDDNRRIRVLEAADVDGDHEDSLGIIRLSQAAFYLDAYGRLTGDEELIDRAGRLLDHATRIGARHATSPALPLFFRGVCSLNATDWGDAVRLFEEADRVRGGGPRFFEWHSHATARLGAGRPFIRTDIEILDQWRLAGAHLPGGIDIYIEAVCTHEPGRPRQSTSLDRNDLDRFMANNVWARNLLISVAQLAARERDWRTSGLLLAIARLAPGVPTFFGSPAGVALYRLTVSSVRDALAKDARDALLSEARTMDLAAGLDLAVEWLASEPRTPDQSR